MSKQKMLSVTLLSLVLMSCNEAKKTETLADVKAEKTTGKAPAIAYVDVDTLMKQYEYCKEFTELMTRKGENIRTTLTNKGVALQKAAADFQEKVQTGGYASKEQAENVQTSLQKQQENLQALQERLSKEFDDEQQRYNNALRDSIQNFLHAYNRARQFTLILSKAGDNILYADPRHDITADVVNGLNKRYQTGKKPNGK